MGRLPRQKLKLLYLRKILREQTDPEHRLSADALVEVLAQYGVSAERKSIYDDIGALQEFGEDVMQYKGRGGGYAVETREFELAELKLLVDAVGSSRFLTERKSRALIAKMEQLASRYQAGALRRQVHVFGRAKTDNECIYYNVDALHAAIAADRQVAFRYFKWALATDGTHQFIRRYQRGGAEYCVSPWALIWDNLNYYLAAYDAAAREIRHFRVDKMEQIRPLDRVREGRDQFTAGDPTRYHHAMFGMFHGGEETVTLRAGNYFADVLRDRFGDDLHPIPVDAAHFDVSVQIMVSPQFFGWLAGLDGGVWPVAPKHVVLRYKETLKKLLSSI